MANIHSQKKRILRAERERLENRRYTSKVKTLFRRLEASVGEGGDKADAEPAHLELVKTIDKAVPRGAHLRLPLARASRQRGLRARASHRSRALPRASWSVFSAITEKAFVHAPL